MKIHALRPLQPHRLPTLDRYELVAQLAYGGMATVFIARRKGPSGFERLVALKRLHPYLSREAAFVEMFFAEARLAARLHHRNIVAVIADGVANGEHYLVMEYVDGVTFGDLMEDARVTAAPLPLSVVARVGLDLLAGLDAAHEMVDEFGRPLRVVHRDVSPQNVLIGMDGSVKLTDFGVARATIKSEEAAADHVHGKLAYMAPEQAEGEEVARSADVFAAAIVLWEALANRRLFLGENDIVTMNKLCFEPIPALAEVRPELHRELVLAISAALVRERSERTQSANTLRTQLERAFEAAGVAAATPAELGSYLEQRFGPTLRERRTLLEHHLAAVEAGKLEGALLAPSGRVEEPKRKAEAPALAAPQLRREYGYRPFVVAACTALMLGLITALALRGC